MKTKIPITTTLFIVAATLPTWHCALSTNAVTTEATPEEGNAPRSIAPRALEGLFSGPTGNSCFTAYITWNATQDTTAMTSKVVAEFYMEKTSYWPNASWNNLNPPSTITIDGETVHSGSHNYNFPANSEIGIRGYLGSGSKVVTHDACGTRSVSISATFDSTGTSFDVFTVSGVASLDQIPVYVVVMYNTTGGSVPSPSTTVQYCGNYIGLAEATKEGHKFDGWYTAAEGGNKVDSNTAVNTNSAHTLYAHWIVNSYAMKFVSNGVTISEGSFAYGTTINYPNDPVLEGYTFAYWCSDSELRTRFTGTTVPAKSIVLYAKFTINNYTITFECGENVSCPQITRDYMTSFADFIPEKTGYTFAHWCSDKELETQYTGTTVPAKSIVLYAKFTINNYTVNFVSKGTTISEGSFKYNTTINYPENPVLEGYTFAYWCSDKELETRFTGTTVPAKSIVLYAKFIANNYTVNFVSNGTTISEGSFTYNTTINYPNDPVLEGHVFNGWTPCPETMGAENITITANWTLITTEYVEIVFARQMSEEEVKGVINKYAAVDSYKIEKFDLNGEDKTVVIVKFADLSKVVEFSRNTNSFKRELIESIDYNPKGIYSSGSTAFHPYLFISPFFYYL